MPVGPNYLPAALIYEITGTWSQRNWSDRSEPKQTELTDMEPYPIPMITHRVWGIYKCFFVRHISRHDWWLYQTLEELLLLCFFFSSFLPLELFCQYHLVGIVKIAKVHFRLWRAIVPSSWGFRLFSILGPASLAYFCVAASQVVNLFCVECFIN